jgi:hypothetical protein
MLLSCMDRLSGTEDLIQRCASNRAGWGAYHEHLNGQPYRIDGQRNVPNEGGDNGQN